MRFGSKPRCAVLGAKRSTSTAMEPWSTPRAGKAVSKRYKSVARLGHLARTLAKLEDVLLTLDARQVHLRIAHWEPAPLLEVGELATITRHFIDFDTANHRELIKQGIAQARAEGRIGGRRHRLKPGQIEELKRAMAEPGADPVDVGKRFGVGRATVYKYLKHGGGE